MQDSLPIHDLWMRPVELDTSDKASVWHVLDFDDHILLRLGSLQAVRLPEASRTPFRMHATADEVWALIEGQADCWWHDTRAGSPTAGNTWNMLVDEPTAMLVPFGVGFGAQAVGGPALLLRLTTESERQAEPALTLPWPDED
jgi:mannose-6-phosphate isomerase-like protein (cupin superfamily)